MNKEIKYLITEITIILLLLIFGLPKLITLNSDRIKTTQSMLENSSNLTVKNNDIDNNTIIIATDDYAINELEKSILTVTNNTNRRKNYNLLLVISKESTIKVDDIKIYIDKNTSLLIDNINYEDDNNYYFNVYTSHVNKTNDIEFAIWIRDDIDNFNGGSLTYYFIIEENDTFALK